MNQNKPSRLQPYFRAIETLEPRTLFSGGLDPSFGVGGIVSIPNVGSPEGFTAVAVQSNHDVLAGILGIVGNQYLFNIYRFTANGVLDPTFGNKGQVLTAIAGADANILSLLVQPNGKIVAAGDFGVSEGNGETTPAGIAVVRYNSNGSLDTTFNSTGIVTFASDYDPKLAWQDGKLLVASGKTLRRLNANGSLDSTFHSGDNGAVTVAIQGDGKILAGSDNSSGDPYNPLVRYNSNGTLDTSFTDSLANTGYGGPMDLMIAPSGTIYTLLDIGAPHTSGGSYLAAFNSTGQFASTFNGGMPLSVGSGFYGAVGMAVQSDNKIIVVEPELVASVGFTGATIVGTQIERFSTTGILDTTFGINGFSDVPFSDSFGGEYGQGSPTVINSTGQLLLGGNQVAAFDLKDDTGSISGYMFYDFNGNGKRDPGDHALHWTCYIDVDNDGHYDNADIRIYTDPSGNFVIPNLAPGVYHIRQSGVAGWTKTTPAEYTVPVKTGETVTGITFASRLD